MNLPSSSTNVIKRRIFHSGSIISNCLVKYVCFSYDLRFILLFYFYCFLYKVIRLGFSPQVFSLLNSFSHNYSSRRHHLYKPLVRSKFCQRCFTFNCPTLWNKLPSKIRYANSLMQFKKLIIDYLKPQFADAI